MVFEPLSKDQARKDYLREVDLKILMNHSLPRDGGNVTRGYVHPSTEHLQECVEKLATFLLAKAGVEEETPAAG